MTPISPLERVQSALQVYFAGTPGDALPDALSAKMLEGFIVDLKIKAWGGWVSLKPEDLGLSADAYEALDLQWGRMNLLHPDIRRPMQALMTALRRLPQTWGRKMRWGRYIPLSAMVRFRTDWDALAQEWAALMAQWVKRYDATLAYAEQQAGVLADRAQDVADQLGEGEVDAGSLIARMLDSYPPREQIAQEFTVQYLINVLPTPRLVAKQAAELELIEEEKRQRLAQMRLDAEQREYAAEEERLRALNAIDLEQHKHEERMAVIRAERERLQGELGAQRQQILSEFYSGYALDIRQRLHEALMFVVEGVRTGKMTPAAGKSLRHVLDELEHLALDDDQEIQQMRERLQAVMGAAGSGTAKPEAIQETVEDLGLLLQTSILALGEQPRMPKRQGKEITAQDIAAELTLDVSLGDRVRQARERSGLDASLAEVLVDAGGLSVADLRERRQRRVVPELVAIEG